MSWIQRLYETYERNQSQVGIKIDESSTVLLPIGHIEARSDIEVTINEKGNFLSANLLDNKEDKIIIPCTESSAGRAGQTPKNHPLSDKLQYLAGDYETYGGKKWFGYNFFLKDLRDWAESEFTNIKLQAVYKYVKKGCLIKDLVEAKILSLNKNGMLEEKWDKDIHKSSPSTTQEQAFVRWRVEIQNDLEPRLWLDRKMYDSWINYENSRHNVKGYCQVLGKKAALALNHPKNIYSNCANAKLISSNDDKNFTYRGRFQNDKEAYGISYEVSQKAHNALKWLIAKQGYAKDKKVILCWGVAHTELPNIYGSSLDLFEEDNDQVDDKGYTAEEVAYPLINKIKGYRSKLNKQDRVVIMGMESATDGRLSITYYQDIDIQDFIERLEKWHLSCSWVHEYNQKTFFGAPSPMDIAESVYGDGKHVDIKAKMRVVERVLLCIIDGYRIPTDIVYSSINKTVHRISFDNALHDKKKKGDLNKVLSVTCALYNKYSKDYKKGEYAVTLENERKSRDYLYGRLLAVAQNIEQWALSKTNESRMTNADRLMHRFAEHPFSTWKTIELSLKPYLNRLGVNERKSRERLLDEIMSLFESEEFISDTRLTGEFLLGYHCQRQELNKKKSTEDN
ncbi:type I-C CRISPR-associated protein Cas8c/Csd1 [Alkaliphilus pronyensis]|uniref:Type I-C CRISPR-associated protein Cas8c/Csd1 n=1 Tax=Alkaliphilus pronyensis TaxID=1482732 RepID=A0A6I0EVI0_9FIRM|nr:type I-C CRISPR-associated protein Cas8c/Csd1 [Alkaliphilus pronyensis]KAB3529679.1 type I-C CRISPR-associated protein Cas8c/Csd1 [Alkaliphilus pronyensis]